MIELRDIRVLREFLWQLDTSGRYLQRVGECRGMIHMPAVQNMSPAAAFTDVG